MLGEAVDRAIRSACVAVAISAGSIVGTAAAQTAPNITPLSVAPDHNSVNITDGQIRIDVPFLSVPAAPRLTFDLLQNAMPHLVATISGGSGDYIESSVSVHSGAASSESFHCIYDDVCNNRKANGSVVGGAIADGGPYTFMLSPNGASYSFDLLEYSSGYTTPRQVQYYASSIAYPDGEAITLGYDTTPYPGWNNRKKVRLASMTDNLGYAITLTYQSNDPAQAGWMTLSQATLVKLSAPGTPLAQLTYGAGGAITDLAGRVFRCAGCVNAIGALVEVSSASVTLPTDGSAAETATSSAVIPNNYAAPPLVSSVSRDGVGWSYAYANPRSAPSAEGYGYDSVVVTGPAGYRQTYGILVGTLLGDNSHRPNLISSVMDALGHVTSYGYDGNYRPTQVTYPEGNAVSVAYDGYGNVVERVTHAKPGSGLADVSEHAYVDAANCYGSRATGRSGTATR